MNGEGRKCVAEKSWPSHALSISNSWDYRFSWIRDASFTVYALIRLGFTAEATAYMEFVQLRIANADKTKPVQIMFGIREESDLTELELDHLEGYRGQRPVRIGNGAADHLQLDVYGEILDACVFATRWLYRSLHAALSVYLSSKFAKPCSWELWKTVRNLVDYVADNYDQSVSRASVQTPVPANESCRTCPSGKSGIKSRTSSTRKS